MRTEVLVKREDIIEICNQGVLAEATRLYGTRKEALKVYASYEGAANLVYDYELDGKPLILRISYTPERSIAQIRAELDFVNYLAEHEVRVSKPVASQNGNLVETVWSEGIPFQIVSFVKGKGMRVPDNDYRYRPDVPIEEYFRNWGRTLGQMHARSKDYQPAEAEAKRPTWFDLHNNRLAISDRVAERLPLVSQRIQSLLAELKALPKDRESYGLIHGDFNDGNFMVDYSNGDVTVFDFDDCCYFWFIYELASAWEGGIGRVMFQGLEKRQAFMDHYMTEVMAGYNQENSLADAWLERLPTFIRLIQVEEFLHYAQYLDEPDEDLQASLRYKFKCIEEEIPYMGFFDSLYSPERPFSLG
jgi:Ser/Thr protein kinase RdoA (MazF antagonist)